MQIIFLERFSKDLDRIKDKTTKERIRKAIEKLEASESLESVPNVKKLTGFTHFYRLRIGDYRIGLIADDKSVELARVAHRKNIYRLFP